MRRGRVRLAGVAGLMAAAAGAATAAPVDPDQPLPCLEASTGNRFAARPGVNPETGVRLTLSGVSEARRLELARDLESLAAQYEHRRNPLFVPLTRDENETLGKLMAWMPLLGTGMNLATGRWESAGGDLVVRPVARCAPGVRCICLTVGMARDDEEQRLRFIAWPLAYAAILRAASDDEAARVADHLRAGERRDSPVALILTAAEIHSPQSIHGREAVARAALRLRAAIRKVHLTGPPFLPELYRVGRVRDDLRWLTLPAGAIVIVPRLAGLAQLTDFVKELRKRLATAGAEVQWLAAPTAP